MKKKFLIVTTVPLSLGFFRGQIQVLKKEFDIELVSSPGKQLKEICNEENVFGHAITMKREISVFNDIRSLFQLLFLFKKIKPTVIHGSTPKAGLLSMFAGWLMNVPHRIYYIHGLRYQGDKGFKRKLLIKMEKMSCYFATDIVAVSRGVKKLLKEEGITDKQVSVIWNGSINGVDINYFSNNNNDILNLKKNYKIDKDNFVFGFIGRMVGDKGLNELIKAFVKVNSKNPATKLVLVGDFENLLDPVKRSTKNEILSNKHIIFAGFQSDVRPFLKMMDVFVFPSYREGFGVALMEAAAMGVLSISSNIIGCNEIIINKYNGLLIPPKSTTNLISAMETLVENPKLIKQMSNVTRQYVIDKFEQNNLWLKTLAFYSDIVNKV